MKLRPPAPLRAVSVEDSTPSAPLRVVRLPPSPAPEPPAPGEPWLRPVREDEDADDEHAPSVDVWASLDCWNGSGRPAAREAEDE